MPEKTSAALAAFSAFPGAESGDISRTLPPDLFQPRLLKEREAVESYGFWIQGEDGSTLFINLLLSNLGRQHQPGIQLTWYGPPQAGKGVERLEGHQEFASSLLRVQPHRISFGPNKLEQHPDGSYSLQFALPCSQGGELAGSLRLRRGLPMYRRGDGKIHLDQHRRHFELVVLQARGPVEGMLQLRGKGGPFRGLGYLDRTAQNLWSHYLARRWFNYRFFSQDLCIACTSLTTPARYGSMPLSHLLVSRGDEPLFATDQHALELLKPQPDPASAYLLPTAMSSTAAGDGLRVDLKLEELRPLDCLDLLEDLNPLLRTLVRAFIARPYTWRYRCPAQVHLQPRGSSATPSVHQGTLVAELIHVNS